VAKLRGRRSIIIPVGLGEFVRRFDEVQDRAPTSSLDMNAAEVTADLGDHPATARRLLVPRQRRPTKRPRGSTRPVPAPTATADSVEKLCQKGIDLLLLQTSHADYTNRLERRGRPTSEALQRSLAPASADGPGSRSPRDPAGAAAGGGRTGFHDQEGHPMATRRCHGKAGEFTVAARSGLPRRRSCRKFVPMHPADRYRACVRRRLPAQGTSRDHDLGPRSKWTQGHHDTWTRSARTCAFFSVTLLNS
jgi:hypothetical protein